MAPAETNQTLPDDDDYGVLLEAAGNFKIADLYDAQTGKVLLIPYAPLDPPPPPPGARPIGIIDSGIEPNHPQLRNLVVAMKDLTGGSDPVDRTGHGTMVALRLAEGWHTPLALKNPAPQQPTQLPPPSQSLGIVSAKVTDREGRPLRDAVLAAIHWMATQNVSIVNMSLGFWGTREKNCALCDAIAQYASAPDGGIRFYIAAGNFGPDVIVYPAACGAPNIVSVGALVDGKVWANSGAGDIYGDCMVKLQAPFAYYYDAGIAACRAGDLATGAARFKESLKAQENAPALYELGIMSIQAGRYDEAFSLLTRADALDPDKVTILTHLGAVRLFQDRDEEALIFLDRAVSLAPENVRALTNRAFALMRTGRLGEAMQDLLKARPLAEDPRKIDGLIAELVQRRRVALLHGLKLA